MLCEHRLDKLSRDNFKKYPSYEESLKDNANLLRRGLRSNSAFYSGTWAENTSSFRDATSWLQGRYATDPTYASKLNRIINQFDLTRYDIVETKKDAEETVRPVAPETPESIAQNPYDKVTTYKIVSGDTLGKIARAFNTTVKDLKAANDLNGDLIFVNQEILVPVIETNLEPEKTPIVQTAVNRPMDPKKKRTNRKMCLIPPDKEESEKENGPED
ncbi:MAG: LysM peptidoglycan-binding domain-containing protein [Alkalibacterium sp.]|nr:LysM peptidoglycan-binding domain-containing protein [Alkalibacterium sp.]